jgi:hypothetical protein
MHPLRTVDWVILAITAAAYLAAKFFSRHRFSSLLKQAWSEHGVAYTVIMALLGAVSYWPTVLHDIVTCKGSSARAIELWTIAALLATFLIFGWGTPAGLLLIIWPLTRISEIAFVFFAAIGKDQPPRTIPRAISLLLIHYAEVVLLASCMHLYLQDCARPNSLYTVASTGQYVGRSALAFFSLVTASTIGFGDIAPNHNYRGLLRFLAYGVVWIQMITVITITAIELPRILGCMDHGTTRTGCDHDKPIQ